MQSNPTTSLAHHTSVVSFQRFSKTQFERFFYGNGNWRAGSGSISSTEMGIASSEGTALNDPPSLPPRRSPLREKLPLTGLYLRKDPGGPTPAAVPNKRVQLLFLRKWEMQARSSQKKMQLKNHKFYLRNGELQPKLGLAVVMNDVAKVVVL